MFVAGGEERGTCAGVRISGFNPQAGTGTKGTAKHKHKSSGSGSYEGRLSTEFRSAKPFSECCRRNEGPFDGSGWHEAKAGYPVGSDDLLERG